MISTLTMSERVRCSLELNEPDNPLGPDIHGPVVALWDAGPLGLDYLCKGCLDTSLDCADSMGGNGTPGDAGEPDSLTWVMMPTDHYCGQHEWPRVLCRDWRHSPYSNTFGQYLGDFRPAAELAKHIGIEPWQVGMASPERPCWCRRTTCTGCSPAGLHPLVRGMDFTA